MRRFESRTLGIQQGSIVLFSDYQDGGQMWTGSGERKLQREIRFKESFRNEPVLQVSLSMWDIDQTTSPRLDLSFNRVQTDSFWLLFRTWGDTRVARVRADWTAIGSVIDDDDWDVH